MMLAILIAAVIIVGVPAVDIAFVSERKLATIIKHHQHHHRTVIIERPAAVQAQIYLIQAQIILAEANTRPEPVRLPVARLLNPSTAIGRYRSHERKS
jgi:hypothetical protein